MAVCCCLFSLPQIGSLCLMLSSVIQYKSLPLFVFLDRSLCSVLYMFSVIQIPRQTHGCVLLSVFLVTNLCALSESLSVVQYKIPVLLFVFHDIISALCLMFSVIEYESIASCHCFP